MDVSLYELQAGPHLEKDVRHKVIPKWVSHQREQTFSDSPWSHNKGGFNVDHQWTACCWQQHWLCEFNGQVTHTHAHVHPHNLPDRGWPQVNDYLWPTGIEIKTPANSSSSKTAAHVPWWYFHVLHYAAGCRTILSCQPCCYSNHVTGCTIWTRSELVTICMWLVTSD